MKPKTRNITAWIIAGLLAFAFLGSGVTKLMGQEMHVQNFERWGFSTTFMYLIGALEVLGAMGVLIMKLRPLAGLGLGLLMIGAVGTHVAFGEWSMILPPFILMILSFTLFAFRRHEVRALTGSKPAYG